MAAAASVAEVFTAVASVVVVFEVTVFTAVLPVVVFAVDFVALVFAAAFVVVAFAAAAFMMVASAAVGSTMAASTMGSSLVILVTRSLTTPIHTTGTIPMAIILMVTDTAALTAADLVE